MKRWLVMTLAVPVTALADASLSLRAEAWSGDRRLNAEHGIGAASAWGSARVDAGAAGQLVGSGWLRTQSNGQGPSGRVRELYWRAGAGPLDLKLGRQIIAWGRADGVNPTDNLTPRDYTLLAPDDGDTRHGATAVNAALTTGAGVLSAIWFPRAAHSTIPLPPLAGVRYVQEADAHRPQWAAKWELSGDGVDGSLSYITGADLMPTLRPGSITARGVEVLLHNERVRVLGADVSLARGGTVWRAEAAWTRTDSGGPADFAHKKPQGWLVAGGEWQIGDGATLGVQAALRHVGDFATPERIEVPLLRELAWRQMSTSGQSARDQHGVVWRLAKRAMNDALLLEASGIALWPSRNGLARVRVSYAISDQLQLHGGLDHHYGKERSLFGQLRANQSAYLQLRYGL